MKYHIEKNTVQETLVIPLYGRKMCSELYPNLFRDETAMRLIEEIDYDFSERGGCKPWLWAGRHRPRLRQRHVQNLQP